MNETFSNLDTIIKLSKDSDTEGFDLEAGTTWIYPTNYPVRDYQFNITQAALFQNTMVSLPTGLGKTFIAAVVMYNFYRWYPLGKIIFMAPTKPLVKQQMDACYNIMAIPACTTSEMTGTKLCSSRINTWREKRVFFITPHILQNDIDTVLELASQIRCVVIDEAHKALGKNANCEAIKKLQKANANFRILALSATPGSCFASVRDVITNLLISHVECRTNESIDVMPYVFRRKLDTIVVPLSGKLQEVKSQFVLILDQFTRPLLQHNILTGNCANLTKGRIVLTMKEFKERGRHFSNYTSLIRSLNICITLYHAYELLIRHGLRAFATFLENSSNAMVGSIDRLKQIVDDISKYLGVIPEIEMLPDGTIPEVTQDIVLSHPKFHTLLEILLAHFKEANDLDTKIMVFCEYRESVKEIYSLLLGHRPTIKPRVFLGQGAITQAQQSQVIKSFKSGICNTLVSTCIGEEGLDVGEVDLIVCFDIHTKSPIRMVQRMGRTGRKRDGRVVILVTEGKEQQMLEQCMRQTDNMTSLLESQGIKNYFYKNNPRMVPVDIKPQCNKMFITVMQPEKPKKKGTKDKKEGKNKKDNKDKSNTLRSMFQKINSNENNSQECSESSNSSTSKHSATTNKSPSKAKSPLSKLKESTKLNNFKQGDIRSMFNRINCTQLSQQSAEVFSEKYNVRTVRLAAKPNTLFTGIARYLDKTTGEKECDLCKNFFDCKITDYNVAVENKTEWRKPDFAILNKITAESLNIFYESFTLLRDIRNENDKMEIDLFSESTTLIDDTRRSLQYFKLDALSDLFSEDSFDGNDIIENPVLFNHSLGNFETSKVNQKMSIHVETPSECQVQKENTFDENVIVSDSDCSTLSCNNWFKKKIRMKSKAKRPLCVQKTSTPNTNLKNKVEPLKSEASQVLNSPITTNNEDDDILESIIGSLIQSSNSTSKNSENVDENKVKSPKEVSNNNDNFEFWDESLFINSDIEDECNKLIEKVSNQIEVLDEAKRFENNVNCNKEKECDKTNTSIQPENLTENHGSKVQEEDDDSDATIEFCLDDFETEKTKFEIPTKLQDENKLNNTKADVTNSTLLNITDIINLLDTSQVKSDNENIINNQTRQVASQQKVLHNIQNKLENNTTNNNKFYCSQKENKKVENIQEKVTISQNETKKIVNYISSTQETIKRSDISNDCAFIECEEEESLLSFSQNTRKNRNKKIKLQLSLKGRRTASQDSPVKVPYKRNIKKTIVISDSDDDFEEPKWVKPAKITKITPKKKTERLHTISSTRKLEKKLENSKRSENLGVKKNTTKKLCDFIEYEADIEEDEHYVSDSDEESADLFESSFVNDTQNIFDQTDMQAKYLQSVRSPHLKRGVFKIPQRFPVCGNVYSQIEPSQDNTYQMDTFCVDNDVVDTQVPELSYLELMEKKIEERNKKSKKRKRKLKYVEDSD